MMTKAEMSYREDCITAMKSITILAKAIASKDGVPFSDVLLKLSDYCGLAADMESRRTAGGVCLD